MAETIRRLKALHQGGPVPPEPDAGGWSSTTPGWVPSVVRDDQEGAGPP